MNILNQILLCSALITAVLSVHATEFTVHTEEFPPFNYTENRTFKGVSTEVVEAVLKQADIDYKIESYPWARTLSNTRNNKHSLVYSISRNEKREKDYRWIGVIVPAVHSVFTLQNKDIYLGSLKDMKNYQIGTIIDDSRESYLLSKGFALSDFQRTSGDTAALKNYRKLKAGRIQLWPMPDAVAAHIVKQAGDNPFYTIKKIYEFSEISKGGYYLAANLDAPEEEIQKISAALEAFKKTEEYKNILKNWGL